MKTIEESLEELEDRFSNILDQKFGATVQFDVDRYQSWVAEAKRLRKLQAQREKKSSTLWYKRQMRWLAQAGFCPLTRRQKIASNLLDEKAFQCARAGLRIVVYQTLESRGEWESCMFEGRSFDWTKSFLYYQGRTPREAIYKMLRAVRKRARDESQLAQRLQMQLIDWGRI